MAFDLQDFFLHLPPELVNRIVSYSRTPTADIIHKQLLHICIQTKLDKAMRSVEFTESDDEEEPS